MHIRTVVSWFSGDYCRLCYIHNIKHVNKTVRGWAIMTLKIRRNLIKLHICKRMSAGTDQNTFFFLEPIWPVYQQFDNYHLELIWNSLVRVKTVLKETIREPVNCFKQLKPRYSHRKFKAYSSVLSRDSMQFCQLHLSLHYPDRYRRHIHNIAL